MRMKAKVYGLSGKPEKEIELPSVFSSEIREDLVRRCIIAFQANRRQPYGVDPLAGKRTSAHYHGRRDRRWAMMNRELARLPRVHNSSPQQNFRARFVPQAVGGRKAHPPKVEKNWKQKVNKKEKKLAVMSAIAATCIEELVKKRGHRFDCELPLIVVNDIENVSKTKELERILINLKLEKELERAKKKKVRAGKGKMRGRRYKKKKSVLIVVAQKESAISKAARNLPGVDVVDVNNLNAEILAPGGHLGRLTLWSEAAIEKLKEKFGG
jgi:large subunit ribosomal protein L4e